MKRIYGPILLALLVVCGGGSAMPSSAGKSKDNKGTRLSIFLSGDPISNVLPKGKAKYSESSNKKGTKREFEVEAEHVNLPNGTVLTVNVNDVPVGTLTLNRGEGKLELNTRRGHTVPAVQRGDVVTVTDSNGATVLHGQF